MGIVREISADLFQMVGFRDLFGPLTSIEASTYRPNSKSAKTSLQKASSFTKQEQGGKDRASTWLTVKCISFLLFIIERYRKLVHQVQP